LQAGFGNKKGAYMQDTTDFFNELEKQGLKINKKQKNKIVKKIDAVLTYEPRIGMFGKTGSGKSSLCNALFGRDICQIDDVAACTRNPQEVIIHLGQKGIKIIDVPGIGESGKRAEEYEKLYIKLLPELDVILWLIKSDDRAFSTDETFYNRIIKPHVDQGKPFLFVISQVDKIEPFHEWDYEKRKPGTNQFQNINKKVSEISSFFKSKKSRIIFTSANEKYNLSTLVDKLVFALPTEKKITFFRQVNEEFRPKKVSNETVRSYGGSERSGVEKFLDNTVGAATDAAFGAAEWVASWFW